MNLRIDPACELPDDPAQAFVGSSLAARSVRDRIRRVARGNAPVLVTGASGTGKEVAARGIHECSTRRTGPFVAIDGGTLLGEVATATLFGHLKGAFTSAVGDTPGAFVEATGGTLFLDEVANLPLGVQAQLLRVLESSEVRPVGSTRTRAIDVRVIAATNSNLIDAVAAGTFRQDLLFRIGVINLRLPALSERRLDVPELAGRLLEGLANRVGRRVTLTDAALIELTLRDWPGNVRQLRNALEHGLAMTDDDVIDREHLPEVETVTATAAPSLPWRRWRDEQERQFLLEHLEQAGWNRSATARALGLSRQGLHDKLRRLDLARKPPLVRADVVHDT